MIKNNLEQKKLSLKSLDIPTHNRNKLKALFPSVFSETLNEEGELEESIDFEKLKAELGTFTEVYEKRQERYGMNWPGKKDCLKMIQQPSIATLKPCREDSVNFDTTEHLFIEGDNLEVLKLLQKSYYGKVKMIYIDPPYNTGKEFVYPDNFQDNLQNYLELTGQTDNVGRRIKANVETSGRYHTKWLNMMYPRLYLARNMLREDGLLFVSIDDNEVLNVRRILDEIFGEENFIECLIWKKRYGGGAKEKYLVSLHEYVLIYAKSEIELENIYVPLTEDTIKRYYTLKDENYARRGPYRTHPLEATKSMGERQNLVFQIPTPDGTLVSPKRQWLWSKERVQNALENKELEFAKDKNGCWSVHTKQYLYDEDGNVRKGKAFSIVDDIYTQHGTNEIIELFGNAQIFSFPKPSLFLQKLIQIGCNGNDESIILDFFSGSCTTAHAILDLNKEDCGNRKFIMVQLPEPCEKKSEAYKAGYRTIADIGKKRIRKVIDKIENKLEEQRKFEANKLLEMRQEIPPQDLGFKVFKLDKSNFKVWDGSKPDTSEEEIVQQLDLFVQHIDLNSSQEDILYELILKSGFMLNDKIEKREMAGKLVYSIAEGAILICLEDEITGELIDAVAISKPKQFICLDRGFKSNDQLKANAVQTFNSLNRGSEKNVEIIFKTV